MYNLIKGSYVQNTQRTLKTNNEKMNNPMQMGYKCAKDLNKQLTQRDIQVANKHMKRCSISYVIKELKIKIIMRYHLEWLKSKTLATTNSDKDGEQ